MFDIFLPFILYRISQKLFTFGKFIKENNILSYRNPVCAIPIAKVWDILWQAKQNKNKSNLCWTIFLYKTSDHLRSVMFKKLFRLNNFLNSYAFLKCERRYGKFKLFFTRHIPLFERFYCVNCSPIQQFVKFNDFFNLDVTYEYLSFIAFYCHKNSDSLKNLKVKITFRYDTLINFHIILKWDQHYGVPVFIYHQFSYNYLFNKIKLIIKYKKMTFF